MNQTTTLLRAISQLAEYNQWVTWRYEERDGKRTKVLKNPHTGFNASSTDPKTWGSYEQVLVAKERYGHDGIGFNLWPDNILLVGVDVDSCIDESGNLSELAQKIVAQADSYTEISPSGRGIRIFAFGVLPEGRRKEPKLGVEMYVSGRFLTVTGNHLKGAPDTISNRTPQLAQLHEMIFGKPQPKAEPKAHSQVDNLDDQALIERIKKSAQGSKFERLWTGDFSAYPSHSEADQALVNILYWWSQGNPEQVKRLFGQSGLHRKKSEREDYLDRAITKAASNGNVRDPSYSWVNDNGVFSTNGGKAPEQMNPSKMTLPALADANPWLPVQIIKGAFYRGETGDAEIFAALYAHRLAYDHAEKQWYLWNGQYWEPDKRKQVGNLIANQIAAQYLHAAAELQKTVGDSKDDQKEIDEIKKRAGSLRYRNKISNVLDRAASQPALSLSGDEWEPNPMLLAVSNGAIDLNTGCFRPGQPSDYSRTAAPVEWQGIDAPAPRWEQFLGEIFAKDQELISFMQRLSGYGVTGLTTEHILPIPWGQGRNGKETLLETLKNTLGDLAGPVSKDVLLDNNRNPGSATPHLYALRPLRLAWVSESRRGARLNIEQVKWLTGGGTITARPLHGHPVTFTPRYLLMLITNHKPKADAEDYALWKRVLLIPFTQSFVDDPKEPGEHKADKYLVEKLKAEAPGILAWLVRGCLEWQRQGLNPPTSVRAETEKYQQEEILPPDMTQFIEDCCILTPDAQAAGGKLYEAYEKWTKSQSLPVLGKVPFGKRLKKRFGEPKSTNPLVIYGGIGLLENEQ